MRPANLTSFFGFPFAVDVAELIIPGMGWGGGRVRGRGWCTAFPIERGGGNIIGLPSTTQNPPHFQRSLGEKMNLLREVKGGFSSSSTGFSLSLSLTTCRPHGRFEGRL